jgi:hypothetical protein
MTEHEAEVVFRYSQEEADFHFPLEIGNGSLVEKEFL